MRGERGVFYPNQISLVALIQSTVRMPTLHEFAIYSSYKADDDFQLGSKE